MIAWFKSKSKMVMENENLRKNLLQMQGAAEVLTSKVEHADLLADRIRTHIALGCPESYARLKRELTVFDKLYRSKP